MTETGNSPTAGLRVLIIDDSKTIRKSAEVLLRKEGCEVYTAEDGFAALALLAEINPQLIFVDIIMPRLDGYQTCAILKDSDQFRGIPVVMLSSKDGSFDRARGSILGAARYLTKPFTRQDIAQVLADVARHIGADEARSEPTLVAGDPKDQAPEATLAG